LVDPFVIVTINDAVVYRSEVIPKNLNPNWKEFDVPILPGLTTVDTLIKFEGNWCIAF
jgi:Ca2+-dependent lipid-binding protein